MPDCKMLYGNCIVSAVLNVTINILLTALSKSIEAYIIFPFVHGLKLILLTALSNVLWKERLKGNQILGCLSAIACICIIAY